MRTGLRRGGIEICLEAPIAENDYGASFTDPETNESYWSNYFVLEGNTLSVSAEQGLLVNDQEWTGENPLEELTAVAVDESNIAEHGGVLPQYGTVSVNSDGSFSYTPFQWVFEDPTFDGATDVFSYFDQDITGQSGSTANVTVDLASLFISWSGDANNLQPPEVTEVWVSQGIGLSVGVKGNANLQGATYSWTIPGYAVEGYTGGSGGLLEQADPDGLDHAVVDVLDAEDYSQPAIHYYWVTNGQKDVSVTVSINGQSGNDNETFSVKRPNVSISSVYVGQITVSQLKVGVLVGPVRPAGLCVPSHLPTLCSMSSNVSGVGWVSRFRRNPA